MAAGFDEVDFPLRVVHGAMGGVSFSTDIVALDGGFEQRNQNWSQARRRYDAATGLRSVVDLATLRAFFHARAGRARGFRLRDWGDYSSALDGVSAPSFRDQQIGVGDGVRVSFQLVKNYGEGDVVHCRVIRKPVVGSFVCGVGGVLVSAGVRVDEVTGVVTFDVPPEAGAIVSAGFLFDVPVRFDTDRLSVVLADVRTGKVEIPLIEIRV